MWERCVPSCGACCFFKIDDTGPKIECDKLKKVEKAFGPRKKFAEKVGRIWFLKTLENYDSSRIGVRSNLSGSTHAGGCPCVFLDVNNGHECKIVRDVGKKYQPTTCKEWSCKTIGKKAQILQRKGHIDIGKDLKHKSIDEIVKILK
jgi:hypothetical protein